MRRIVIFYDNAYFAGDLVTHEELAGPFPTLHLAFKWVDANGYEVSETARTRGLVKHRSRDPLEPPA